VGVVVVLVFGQQYVGSVFVLALSYGIVTAGMAVQIGFSQQIVFSQCVFMAFGAYGVAMLNTHFSMPSLLATPVVMVASGLAALLLGSIVTRASGLALAVATLMLPLIATGYISSAGYLGGSVGAPLTGNLWPGSDTGQADRGRAETVLRRHEGGRLHQREPAGQQPGGLGRRAGDQLGGDQRRDA
jgi:ABC-type branched-subunit amino acid transport system permease subunit